MSESDFDYGGRGVSCFARPAYSPLDRDKGGALDPEENAVAFPSLFFGEYSDSGCPLFFRENSPSFLAVFML